MIWDNADHETLAFIAGDQRPEDADMPLRDIGPRLRGGDASAVVEAAEMLEELLRLAADDKVSPELIGICIRNQLVEHPY